MRTQDAIDFYGTKAALARALGLKPQTVHEWGESPPPLRQLQLERLTRGRLKAHAGVFGEQRRGKKAVTA